MTVRPRSTMVLDRTVLTLRGPRALPCDFALPSAGSSGVQLPKGSAANAIMPPTPTINVIIFTAGTEVYHPILALSSVRT